MNKIKSARAHKSYLEKVNVQTHIHMYINNQKAFTYICIYVEQTNGKYKKTTKE